MSSTRFAPTSLTSSKSGTQSLYVVPPFDVNPAIISRAANALSDSFDKVVGDLSASQSGAGGTSNVIAADMLTHQHLSKVFREVKGASDTYARLMGVQYPRDVNHATTGVPTPPTTNTEGAEAGAAEVVANATATTTTRSPNTNNTSSNTNNQDRDGAHMFEFLIPYTWQQMQQSLQIGKNAGRTIGELRSDIAAIKSYWDNAYTQIQNDILPFMVRGAKILVLGEGRLISNVIETGLKFAKGAQFYVLEARPDLPHEELSQMHLGITGGLGAGGSPPAGGSQQSCGSSCCGARLVERVCRRTKGQRANMRLVPDSCAASILASCNFVLMSAYAATKNGGIVHRAGSLQLASLAKVMNVPVYVVCESFKFRPIFPLSSDAIAQPSIPEGWKEQIAQHGGYNGVERVIPSYLPRTSAAALVGIGAGIGGMSVNYPPHQGGAFSPTRIKSVEGHSEPSFPASGLPSTCGPSPIMLHGVSTTLNSGALVGLPPSSSSSSCANHDAATVEGGAPPPARTRANVRLNAATPSFGIVLGDAVPLSNHILINNNTISNSAQNTDASSSKFLNRLREENQHGHVAFHHSGTKNVSVIPVTNSGAPATVAAAATAPISTEQTAVPPTSVESAELSVEPLPPPKFLEFVPGDLITFFFTDRRILPPSGVVMDINQTFPLTQN